MYGIYGNEKLINSIFHSIKEDKPAGCYIIEGENGSGKLTLARLFAAYLCCQNRKENGPCLECKSCKNILAGNHIDVNELCPPEKGKKISVDMVRDFLRKTYVTPSESNYRVFIIRHSEDMKKEAQNALLKSIEEPGKNVVFFLLTNDKSLLLPTVKSRAVKLCTETLPDDAIKEILRNKGINFNNEDFPLFAGSCGKALEILGDSDYKDRKALVTKYFNAILSGASFNNLSSILSPNKITRPNFKEILKMLKSASADILVRMANENSKPRFFTDSGLLNDIASVASKKTLTDFFNLTEKLLILNENNINVFSSVAELNITAKNILK